MKRIIMLGLATTMLSALTPQAWAGEFEDALKAAYETNPRVHAQRRTLDQADERVSQAIANFRPNVSATYGKGRQRTRFDTNQWSYDNTTTRELSVEQPIFQGGSNFFRYYAAKNRVLASREDLRGLEQRVLLDAVIAYMTVVQNESVLRLSQSNQDVLARQLEAANNRFEVGDVTRTDVAQSQARFARAQADAIQAQGDLDSALAEFERVIGYRPENLPLPVPDNLPALPATLEEAIETAMKNNPDLGGQRHLEEAFSDDVGTTVGGLLPQVSLVGSMRRQDGAGVTGSSQFDTDAVTLNVSVPIYQRGAQYSRVREARVLAKRAEFQVEDAEDAVRESVIQAWENLQTAIATITAQEEAIDAAEIALDGVRKEQQYGARTILDVLDAEQELFIARVNLVRAQRNRIVSIYNMLSAVGDLDVTALNLDTKAYDPEEHYDSVKWQLIGF